MEAIPVPNRRRFINWLLGTSFGALIASVIYPIIRYVSPPKIAEASTAQIEAGDTNDPELLQKGFKIVRFGSDAVIVIRVSDTDVKALSATCTHLDCIVGYKKDQSQVYCNCHGGTYDVNGRNISGPPPRPLAPYKVNLVPKKDTSTIVVSKA
ncbi:MAG: QcrA and Rieske domain-containing protein [Thermoanaerobaculia bacterium]